MNGRILGLLVMGLIVAPASAYADSVTYDWTGVVTEGSGSYLLVPVGTNVSGTFTFNISNANPDQSIGTVGSTTDPWESQVYGGSVYSLPLQNGQIFSSTLNYQIDGQNFGYASSALTPAGGNSSVQGYVDSTGSVPNAYVANELVFASSASFMQPTGNESGFTLIGTTAPYTAVGLPVYSQDITTAAGFVEGFSAVDGGGFSDLEYNITSMTPVPLSAPEVESKSAASALTLLLGGLAVLRGRRRTAVT